MMTEKKSLKDLTTEFQQEEIQIRKGGDKRGQERQKAWGRLTARKRLDLLLDDIDTFFEIGLWAGHEMYEAGPTPAAGVIAGIGKIEGRECMIIANDATVKAGAMFPQSIKKTLKAQRIAYECRLPIIYLVDCAGIFLPLQDEIFPDEDDYGRIFRNNAILSAEGIPQFAAVMGNCVAGGAYLPLLCDKILMTEGSGIFLAGPALVKAAIGQEISAEELGGAKMHSEISGSVDFFEPDDESCLKRLRSLIDLMEKDPEELDPKAPESSAETIYELVGADNRQDYDAKDLIATLIDKDSFQEFKRDYGKTLVTAYAKIDDQPVGIIANQRFPTQSAQGQIEVGGVIYAESADKAARFVMDCNQLSIPLIFLQDVVGFMVGRDAEESGIIRRGAKLVSAVSNSVVPKITIIVGNSFGAGHYALCGKAYDPNFIFAWPNAQYAVMGSNQAAGTLFSIQKASAEKAGNTFDDEELKTLFKTIHQRYEHQSDIRYGAARGWVDAIIAPESTREILCRLLPLVSRKPLHKRPFHTGVFQV
jgi:3-methylcrotonyl-CoA carboxylase beta subunit